MPTLVLITEIRAPLLRCFDLARSIDLHKLSTAATGEQAVAGRTTGLIGLGEQVTWRARHFGFWQELTSEVTQWEDGVSFTDVMVKGAFHSFTHRHSFSFDQGITTMQDEFCYVSPFGPLGWLADLLFLKRYMYRLLSERNKCIRHYAESPAWKEVPGVR